MRRVVLALVVLAALALAATRATADDSTPPVVCVSAIGPVDASGRGDITPVEAGDCP